MPPYRLIAFDLDGTLIDSRPDIAAALNALLVEEGLATFDERAIDPLIGEGARALVERALAARLPSPPDAAVVTTALARYQALYRAAPVARTVVYPGVVEGLARLGGISLAVATNKPGDLARIVVEALGLARFFDVVLGEGDVPLRKPDPAMLRAAMRVAGAAERDTLYVGDGPTDVRTANAAGVDLCLVGWGYPGEAAIDWDGARAATFDDVVRLSLSA